MSQVVHYAMLVFIVFVLAEIRNIIVSHEPYSQPPLTIWEEAATPQKDVPLFGIR